MAEVRRDPNRAPDKTYDEICADLDAWAQKVGMNFALILWLDGKSADKASVGLASNPRGQPHAVEAIQTAVAALNPDPSTTGGETDA